MSKAKYKSWNQDYRKDYYLKKASDPAWVQLQRDRRNASWAKNREHILAKQRARYKNDPAYREKMKLHSRSFYDCPAKLAALKLKRKIKYWKDPVRARLLSRKWIEKNYEVWKKRNDARRYANRDKHNAYCRLKAILCTDGYCREQLSKYHPTKSCKDWTQAEVDTKRESILLYRARKITKETVRLIRAEYRQDQQSTRWSLSQKYNVGFSNTYGILTNKFHHDPDYVPSKRIRNITKTQKTFALLAASADIAKAINAINENSDTDPG